MLKIPGSFDVIGSIAILKFGEKVSGIDKKRIALILIKKHKNIKTVVEKSEIIKGRLRKFKTKHLAGEKTKEVLYKENNCLFRFNIDETYFSGRLSNERQYIADKIKKNSDVLCLFSGAGFYPIVIAKNKKIGKIVSVEINRKANDYAEKNVFLNKVENKIEIIQGDVKKVISHLKDKFDFVVVTRPNLENLFLDEVFSVVKKGTVVFYHYFSHLDEKEKIKELLNEAAKKKRKKIKILDIKKSGEIAPYKFRWLVEFKTL